MNPCPCIITCWMQEEFHVMPDNFRCSYPNKWCHSPLGQCNSWSTYTQPNCRSCHAWLPTRGYCLEISDVDWRHADGYVKPSGSTESV